MADLESRSEMVAEIAEEFAARYRRGERPSVSEYVQRCPEAGDEIREVLSMLVHVEQLAPCRQDDFEAHAPLATPPIQQLGDFRVVREIGRGGMGVVYEAEQVSLGRQVALKVLPPQLVSGERQRIRFEREAKAAARLHHTNIVPVFGVGHQDGLDYYVMQFIDGRGLDEVVIELRRLQADDTKFASAGAQATCAGVIATSLLTGQFDRTEMFPKDSACREDGRSIVVDQRTPREAGPAPASAVETAVGRLSATVERPGGFTLPGQVPPNATAPSRKLYWHSVARIGMQAAQALQYAHEQGIIHRDVKPANLLLDKCGVVWVTDFGLAKVEGQQDLTHTGDVLGTLRYLAPEQFEGKADSCSDVYALGLTLYELLTLQPAFHETERHRLIQQVTHGIPPRARMIAPQIPRDLETIVHKAIDRDPSHRYPMAGELAADLQRYLSDEPIKARRASVVTRLGRWCKRNPMGTAVVALLTLMAVGGPFVAFEQSRLRQEADDANVRASERAEESDVQRREAVRQTELAHFRAAEAEQATWLARMQEQLARQQRDLTLENLYIAHIRLAHEDWNSGHLMRMIQTLEVHRPQDDRPDFRGWEWYYLAALAQKQDDVFTTQLGAIGIVKWSPDGRLVAIAGERGVQILEPVSQQVVQQWPVGRPRPQQQQAVWSADGSRFAIVGWDQGRPVIQVLSTEDWKQVHAVATGNSNDPLYLTSTADGDALAWKNAPRSFSIWKQGDKQPAAFRLPAEWDTNANSIISMAWSPQGRFLAIGTHFPAMLGVWDSVENRFAKTIDALGRGITHLSWTKDGRRVATSSIEGNVLMWDVAGEKLVQPIGAHHGWSFQCDWSPDETQMVSVGEDNLIRIWSAQTGQQISRLPGHRAPVLSVDWSPRGDAIVTGCSDGSVRFWRPAESRDALLVPGRSGVAWNPDGTRVVSNEPYSDGPVTCSVRDSRTGQIVTKLEVADGRGMHVVAWSPDGKLIAGAGYHGSAHVWNAATGEQLHTFDAHERETRCVAWSPDNQQFATCGMDRLVKIWETSTGKLRRAFSDHAELLGSVCWSPDGRWFASVDWGRDVVIRSAETWEVEWKIDLDRSSVGPGAGGTAMIAWSPDSQQLATVRAAGNVVVWRLREEQPLQQIWSAQAHTSNIRSMAWSPDGRRIASASEDRSVKIWDAASGRELLVLDGHTNMVKAVAWSPDGRRLASADNSTIRIWDAAEAYQQQDQHNQTASE